MNPRSLYLSLALPPLIAGFAILALWQTAVSLFGIPQYLLPSPIDVLHALARESHSLLPAALRTGGSALVGFGSAVGGGALVALILASSRWVKAALYPWVLALQMVPVVVLIPIFVIWFGAGLPSITAASFIISFFPVVASTTLGLVSTDRGLLELFAVNGATPAQEILLLRLPYALPYFLTGVKIAATLAPIGAISGEFLAGTQPNTLGYLLLIYRSNPGKMPEVFAVALVTCALGFLFVGAVQLLTWLLLRRWHESSAAAE
jgi:NitT/TauT family transport system permease protein